LSLRAQRRNLRQAWARCQREIAASRRRAPRNDGSGDDGSGCARRCGTQRLLHRQTGALRMAEVCRFMPHHSSGLSAYPSWRALAIVVNAAACDSSTHPSSTSHARLRLTTAGCDGDRDEPGCSSALCALRRGLGVYDGGTTRRRSVCGWPRGSQPRRSYWLAGPQSAPHGTEA